MSESLSPPDESYKLHFLDPNTIRFAFCRVCSLLGLDGILYQQTEDTVVANQVMSQAALNHEEGYEGTVFRHEVDVIQPGKHPRIVERKDPLSVFEMLVMSMKPPSHPRY